MKGAARAALYLHVNPLDYLGLNPFDRAVLDITTNAAITEHQEAIKPWVGLILHGLTGVNPFDESKGGSFVDETVTPENPAQFTLPESGQVTLDPTSERLVNEHLTS